MKKGVVSLAAVLMVLASLATPSYAGKIGGSLGNSTTYEGQNFTVTYSVGTAVPGGTLATRLSIRVNPDGAETARRMVGWNFQALSQERSGFAALPVNKTKTINKNFVVPERMQPGTYNVVFTIQVGDELKSFQVPVVIGSK